MDISVIVPVYNVEKYLVDCIESILRQTFQGTYEVILVDDGSIDGSGKICDRYSQRCRVIHQSNRGVSAARNVGIRAAQGEYLSFVDSDDTLRENALETLWQKVVEHPGVDVVVGQIEYAFCSIIQELSFSNDRRYIRSKDIRTILGGVVYGKLIRRDVVMSNEIFFNERIKCCEDALWLFFLHKHINSIAWCHENVYLYRRDNAESITRAHSGQINNYIYCLKAVECMCANMSEEFRHIDQSYISLYLNDVISMNLFVTGEPKRRSQAARHTYKELRRSHAGFQLCYKAWLLTYCHLLPPVVIYWLSHPLLFIKTQLQTKTQKIRSMFQK